MKEKIEENSMDGFLKKPPESKPDSDIVLGENSSEGFPPKQ